MRCEAESARRTLDGLCAFFADDEEEEEEEEEEVLSLSSMQAVCATTLHLAQTTHSQTAGLWQR